MKQLTNETKISEVSLWLKYRFRIGNRLEEISDKITRLEQEKEMISSRPVQVSRIERRLERLQDAYEEILCQSEEAEDILLIALRDEKLINPLKQVYMFGRTWEKTCEVLKISSPTLQKRMKEAKVKLYNYLTIHDEIGKS